MSVLLLLVISVITSILWYFWVNRRYFYLLSKIPTRNVIGFKFTLKDTLDILKSDVHYLTNRVYKTVKFEKGTTKSLITNTWMVMVQNPDDLRIIMNSKNCLDKSDFQKVCCLDKGMIFGSLDIWRSHSKIMKPFFGTSTISKYFPGFNEKSKKLAKLLSSKINGGQFNIFDYAVAVTLEGILELMEFKVDILNMEEKKRYELVRSLDM